MDEEGFSDDTNWFGIVKVESQLQRISERPHVDTLL